MMSPMPGLGARAPRAIRARGRAGPDSVGRVRLGVTSGLADQHPVAGIPRVMADIAILHLKPANPKQSRRFIQAAREPSAARMKPRSMTR